MDSLKSVAENENNEKTDSSRWANIFTMFSKKQNPWTMSDFYWRCDLPVSKLMFNSSILEGLQTTRSKTSERGTDLTWWCMFWCSASSAPTPSHRAAPGPTLMRLVTAYFILQNSALAYAVESGDVTCDCLNFFQTDIMKIRIRSWNFLLGFAMLLRTRMQKKLRKSILEIPIYANFSFKSAPKLVGRIDPSRL